MKTSSFQSTLAWSNTQSEMTSWDYYHGARLPIVTLLVIMVLAVLLSTIAYAQSPVLQRGYDAGVTGATLNETTLNTTNVNPSTFGLIFNLPVDDAIFAQPLYVPNVVIQQVAHNVLYVATMNDTLYAFDADTGGAPLWSVNLASLVGATSVPIGHFVFSGDRGIVGNLGVLSTPVIDLSTNTLYVVACDLEGVTPSTPNGNMVYRLHAIDITTGATRTGSGVQISGTYGGVTFDAIYLLQRMSLTLVGNQVVFGFAAMQLESANGYAGWVMAYDKSTLTQTGVFATVTTGNYGGGVWQSGRPPVVDSSGYVYVFVGNAYGGGYDGVNNFSESVLKLDPAQGLKLIDWFTPSNWSALDSADQDLTGSGPMLIPGTSLIAGGGKAGTMYVLNTSNLGKYNARDTQVVQKLNFPSEIRGGPVYWPRSAANGGPLMYHWGVSDTLKSFAFNGTTFATTPTSQGIYSNQIYPGGILTLSANGETPGSGIVWATTAYSGDAENNPPVPGELHAFNAGNVSQELWNSTMNPMRDGFGNFAKFVPPLVDNGRVYVATWSNRVAVYGLLSGTAPVSVPIVVGLTEAAARTAITGATLTVGTVTNAGGGGLVTLQSPAAGTLVAPGTAVAFTVATANVPVPTVVGLTEAAARTAITGATLIVGTVTNAGGGGLVTIQSPAGGVFVAPGAAVSFTVATAGSSVFGVDNSLSSDGAGTRTLTGFNTTSSGDLLLGFVGADGPSGGGQTATVSGAGLSWTLVRRVNVQAGTSEIWKATATGVLSGGTKEVLAMMILPWE